MKVLPFTLLLIMISSPLSSGQEHLQPRVWTGKNGVKITATYAGLSDEGEKVMLMDARGKLIPVTISNLIESDQALIANRHQKPGKAAKEKPTGTGSSAFADIPALDRAELPVISQGDFGSKASDCVPSSFCNFLLWWDKEGMLEIPKRGDFEKKAEWIHTRMARYCGTRNTAGTSASDAIEGFTKYFEKDIDELATLRIHIDYNVAPGNLSRYTVGANATMLEVTIRTGAQHDSSHWVALAEATPDGKLSFNTWGARFEGKLKVLEENENSINRDGQQVPRTTYEIEISNSEDLPEWFQNSDRHFILDPENWDSVFVLKPYVFSAPGERAEPPSGPFFEGE